MKTVVPRVIMPNDILLSVVYYNVDARLNITSSLIFE
jgi:hypothetical protein